MRGDGNGDDGASGRKIEANGIGGGFRQFGSKKGHRTRRDSEVGRDVEGVGSRWNSRFYDSCGSPNS